MAPKVYDRVKEYTVSTGVGGITFVGAFNGFQKFSDVLLTGETTYYVIEENDKWEVGIGTYGSNNLERDTVLSSSNGGSKINLGGSGVVSITYPAGRAAFSDEVDYVSGIAVYSSGQAITNRADISTNSSNINYVSGVANYASGQAVDNESQISSVSGWADSTFLKIDDDSYVSGVAVYASGQSISNQSNISTNTGNISTNTAKVNYASGQAIENESQISSVSGWAGAYADAGDASVSGWADSTFIKVDDDSYVSGIAAYASGQAIVNESDIAANTSNISTNTARVEYASGQAILNQGDIASVSGLIGDADFLPGATGSLIDQNTQQIASVSGWSEVYTDNQDAAISGWVVSQDHTGVAVSGWANATFATDIDLVYVSGVAAGAGGVTIEQLEYVSGIALYSSGQAINNQSEIISVSGWAGVYADAGDASVSGWASSTFLSSDDDAYVSGVASYASGQAILNESEIVSVSGWAESYVDSQDHNAIAVSGWADSTFIKIDDDSYVSGVAAYASGQAIENETGIEYVSGIAVYASGNTLQRVTDNGASTTNAITITDNNITASSGLFDSLDMTPLGNGSQPAYQEGVVFYDSENHTLSLYNDEADVTLQLGQEEFLRVRNNTGATIQNGTAVLINGAHGNAAPTVSGAIATSEASSQVVGLATHSIEDNSFGYVTTYGIVRDVDTSAFSTGDEVFLSATQIGSGVAVAPVIPNYKISLGHVINSASSNGSILVQVGNPKLGGGDLKSEAPLNMSGVPFVTSISDTTAGGSQTDPLFVYDSGNNQLQLASLFIEPNAATKIGEVIKGAVSQSVNLQEWQNSSQNTLSHIDTSGVYGNIIGSNGTDVLRLQYGDPLHDNDGSTGVEVKAVWLDYEDGSEYATPINNNSLVIGTWYNTARTIPSRIKISATAFNLSLANSSKIDCQGTTTKFNTDVTPWSSSSTWDLGSESVPWTNVYASDTVYASGLSASGVELGNHVPADTTNKLYNNGGTLSFNGSAVDTTYDDTYVSGIATYASGQAISNQSNISTNTSNISSNTAKVNYASGLAIANETDISYVSGVAAKTFTVTAADSNNYTFDGMGLNSDTDPTIYLHKGHTYYFDKQTSSHPFRVSTSNGGAAYQDADGNNIEISGQGVLKFEVPQDAPDKLYYYCTSHASMNGVIYTTNNVDEIIHVSGIAFYASGQAITNESNIETNASNISINTGKVNYASGQAIENEIDIAYVSGIAVYASGEAGSGGAYDDTYISGIAVYASGQVDLASAGNAEASKAIILDSDKSFYGVKHGNFDEFDSWVSSSGVSIGPSGLVLGRNTPSDTTDTLYNVLGTLYFNGSQLASAGGASAEAQYASGQAIENEIDIAYVSGIAVYASGNSGGGGSSLTAGSGVVIDGSDRINIYGGSGHFQNIQLETTGTEDALLLTSTDAGSDAAPVISTMRDSASPADGDYLGQLKFKGRSDTGTERVYAKITGKTLDVTNGTEDGVIEIAVRANGSNEIVSRIRNDGIRILNDNNLCVEDGGNVGIRNISPSYPLDVEGDAHVASGLLVGDTLDVSGVSTFDQVATFQSGIKTKINTEADAATITFDMDQSNVHMVTLGDNRTLAVSNVDVGQKFLVRLQQDSTGSRTVTWWGNIQWAEGGTEPTLTTTGGKADLFGFLSPSGGYYDGFVVGQNI